MSVELPPASREEAQARLVARAAEDPEFRAALKRDPRKVIGEVFGMPMPPNLTIEVLEETPAHYYVVLPAAEAGLADGELADGDLEAVAGGFAKVSTGINGAQ